MANYYRGAYVNTVDKEKVLHKNLVYRGKHTGSNDINSEQITEFTVALNGKDK